MASGSRMANGVCKGNHRHRRTGRLPGPVIAECLQGAGYEVIFQATECFV